MERQSADTLPQLTIATDADVPAVVSLINVAFRGRGEDAGWSNKEVYAEGTRITEDLMREDIAARPQATLLPWRSTADSVAWLRFGLNRSRTASGT